MKIENILPRKNDYRHITMTDSPSRPTTVNLGELRRMMNEETKLDTEEKRRHEENRRRQENENVKIRIALSSVENMLNRYENTDPNIKNVLLGNNLLMLLDIGIAVLENSQYCDDVNKNKASMLAQKLRVDLAGLMNYVVNHTTHTHTSAIASVSSLSSVSSVSSTQQDRPNNVLPARSPPAPN